mmetsp:Transcript_4067/g.7503  ORF Transcript_4067/g.7503 Transcript_4067/m.7503 type:complete len:110 (+) Transcript_4067:136-465(+)
MYRVSRNSSQIWRRAATTRFFSRAPVSPQAMKPGTPIPGLNFMKGKEPIVALKREEYPDWINDLDKPKITLAKLRRMPEEEATDRDKMRYLKLTRRFKMKDNNSAAEAQ